MGGGVTTAGVGDVAAAGAGSAHGGDAAGTFIGGKGEFDGSDEDFAALLARRNASLIALMRQTFLRVHELRFQRVQS